MAVGLTAFVVAGGVLYNQALTTVDRVIARPLWDQPGRILGTLEVRGGLNVGPRVISQALSAAGYSNVSRIETEGDFVVAGDGILVLADGEEVLITFDQGSVASVSPYPVYRFDPPRLAGVFAESERREPVSADQVPERVVQAVLAMEDARFFSHPGFDALGLARALITNVIAGSRKQGGSTLTQQLAKNLFLTPTKSYERKARELLLAVALEQRLSKDEILNLYLNQVYLGQVGGVAICGFEEAARTYFDVSASRLTLGQAATLAGIISAPNRFSPTRHPSRAQERRDLVIDRMQEIGWIDRGEADAARAEPLAVAPTRQSRQAPWAIDTAVSIVEEEMGDDVVGDRGLTVHTTIDVLLQQIAESTVEKKMAELARAHPTAATAEVALVAVEPSTGDILAMVGGRSYRNSSFNRATLGSRQVGSTVKPLTWLLAYELDVALSPSSTVPNESIERDVNGTIWNPRNYDGSTSATVTLDRALALSHNIPAVHVSEMVGLGRLADHLKRQGLQSASALPSVALGAFEASPQDLASAYTVFPGGGKQSMARLVESVRLPDGTERDIQPVRKQRVSSSRAAFLTQTTLERVLEWGTGRSAAEVVEIGSVGGKTGTTDRGRDAWFVGFTSSLVVAVWVGHDKAYDLGRTGAQAALPIWAEFISRSGHMGSALPSPPSGIAAVPVCTQTGQPAVAECDETTMEWFSESDEAVDSCVMHGSNRQSPKSIIEGLRRRLTVEESDQSGGDRPKPWGWFKRRRAKD